MPNKYLLADQATNVSRVKSKTGRLYDPQNAKINNFIQNSATNAINSAKTQNRNDPAAMSPDMKTSASSIHAMRLKNPRPTS